MARIFITGSTEGLGRLAGESLVTQGHEIVLHARNNEKSEALKRDLPMIENVLVGDLSVRDEVLKLADEANAQGGFDAIIHNAGGWSGEAVIPVNVIAPYLLTCLMPLPERLIYLSSGMHYQGHASVDNVDWKGNVEGSYADSKLYITTFVAALARPYPSSFINAVDPGWVPTRMGGADATDDLADGYQTQEWLAASSDADALTSGGLWHHMKLQEPHEAVHDIEFQNALLAALANETGVELP